MGIKFDDSVLVVLTTAPAGLGHIRVMEALREGLSPKTRLAVMGVMDASIQWIHRLTSRNPFWRQCFEFSQRNLVTERYFSKRYRDWLRKRPTEAAKQLSSLVSMAWPQPETVVVVATHFGLAHQLAAVKPLLAGKLGIKLLLAVVVTDDSPEEMWAVPGADVIFVPSNTTREAVLAHLLRIGGAIPEVITTPYPVSLSLASRLAEEEYLLRQQQVNGRNLKIMIPVSGAAVQLDYYQQLMQVVAGTTAKVTVVSRESSFTQSFLEWCRLQHGIQTVSKQQDADVVAAYAREYELEVFGIEVTKPSEQAFKVLLTPKQRGGVVLLFSPPVGRQEYNNVAFLRRHKLIPSVDDQARINEWCVYGNSFHITPKLLARARHWRGIMLPPDGVQAGVAIGRLVESGILTAMVDFGGFLEGHDEISSDGVKEIWNSVEALVSRR